jgi:hypothetical protein
MRPGVSRRSEYYLREEALTSRFLIGLLGRSPRRDGKGTGAELRMYGVLRSSNGHSRTLVHLCEGSSPFETSQARADTVGLPGVASGNCAPCGIRSIGNPDAASILPEQLKNEMRAVAS